MITTGLAYYLTYTGDLEGPAATMFVRPQECFGLSIRNRNDARRHIRDRVGDAVYAYRRPMDTSRHTAIVLTHVSTTRDYTLRSDTTGSLAIVQIDTYTRGPDAAMRGQLVGNLIRLATSSYYGGKWGDFYVGHTEVSRDAMLAELPRDSSDDWSFNVSMDLAVWFGEPAVLIT